MATARSGLIIAAAYADKLRRVVFAQITSEHPSLKKDKEAMEKINYYIGLLNRALFTLLVEQLKVDKLDVVRISIDYEFKPETREIVWKWDTLRLEVYKRVPPETYEGVIKSFIARANELALSFFQFELSKIGELMDGDVVYSVRIGEKDVGAALVLPVDSELAVLKLAAILEPTPVIFEKTKLSIAGKTIEDALKEQLGKLVSLGKHVSYDDAHKIVNYIRAKAEAKPIEKATELVSEEE